MKHSTGRERRCNIGVHLCWTPGCWLGNYWLFGVGARGSQGSSSWLTEETKYWEFTKDYLQNDDVKDGTVVYRSKYLKCWRFKWRARETATETLIDWPDRQIKKMPQVHKRCLITILSRTFITTDVKATSLLFVTSPWLQDRDDNWCFETAKDCRVWEMCRR